MPQAAPHQFRTRNGAQTKRDESDPSRTKPQENQQARPLSWLTTVWLQVRVLVRPHHAGLLLAICLRFSACSLALPSRAFSVLMESEPRLWFFVLTRFLHANRYPLRSKTL